MEKITFDKILNVLKKYFIIIIASAVVAAALAYVYTAYFVTPSYVSQVKLFVDLPVTSTSDENVTATERKNYSYMVATYIALLNTNDFFDILREDMGLTNYTTAQLRNATTFAAVGTTEVFSATVSLDNAAMAKNVADAISKNAPVHLKQLMAEANLKVVDPPVEPSKPAAPNVPLYTIIGFLLGMLLAVGIFLMKEILDVRIKNTDEITARYKLPILGVVPNFTSLNDANAKKKAGKTNG